MLPTITSTYTNASALYYIIQQGHAPVPVPDIQCCYSVIIMQIIY